MASVQYLDELFSALRDTAAQLALVDTWFTHLEDTSPVPLAWRMSILQSTQRTLTSARKRFEEAQALLAALGPREQLPTLLAPIPDRLLELQQELEFAEQAIDTAWTMSLYEPSHEA